MILYSTSEVVSPVRRPSGVSFEEENDDKRFKQVVDLAHPNYLQSYYF